MGFARAQPIRAAGSTRLRVTLSGRFRSVVEEQGTILAVPPRTLGNSAADKCYGLRRFGRRGFIGPHKYKTGCHGDMCVGAAILADEN